MKSIVLLICSVIATTLFAQPTTLDMKERYYMKGEVSEVVRKNGGGNTKMATQDEEGNIYYVGSGLVNEVKKGDYGKSTAQGDDQSYSLNQQNTIYDCLLVDGSLIIVSNPFFAKIETNAMGVGMKKIDDIKTISSTTAGYQRAVYNSATGNVIVFGGNKEETLTRAGYSIVEAESFESKESSVIRRSYPYFPVNDGEKLKNDMAAVNSQNIAIFIYNTQDSYSDYSNASIGLLGVVDKVDSEAGKDKIDVKAILENFVSDFRPYTSYENKAYEQVNKVQWAISGIHPKEDGTFLITASFIHWTTTASGKAGYQKGILGVVYQPTSKAPISEQWVVFPWAVKETTNMQEKMEIKPYYTSYIGGNDIAVFDQETGHLFAINSDLDACKSTDELGTCQAKSKELQKWLIVNRLIARIEPTGYSLGFAHPNTAPANGERKAITLVQNVNGSEFKVIKFNP